MKQSTERSISSRADGYVFAEEASKDSALSFYRWSTQLSSALVRSRERFAGDLDQLLIFMVFVDAEASRSLSGNDLARSGPRGLNALSVADITRIPRETTRRKLRVLTDGGFLRYGQDCLYYLAQGCGGDEVYADLQKLFAHHGRL